MPIGELRDLTNETVALAVWNDGGPVIVRWERPRRPITVNVLTGTSLSLLSSAAGRVFAAWLPEQQTEALLRAEIESGRVRARHRHPRGRASLARRRPCAGAGGDLQWLFRPRRGGSGGPGVQLQERDQHEHRARRRSKGRWTSVRESPALLALKDACDALSLRLGATAIPGAEAADHVRLDARTAVPSRHGSLGIDTKFSLDWIFCINSNSGNAFCISELPPFERHAHDTPEPAHR